MKTVNDITRGCAKKVHCQKKENSTVSKCVDCKEEIKTNDKYFFIGLRATTAHERFYARKGCVWYSYCEACA